MQFRQKALAKLQSPDELDTPLRLANSRGWLVLSVLALMIVVGGIWSVTGSLPRKLSAPGILTHTQGSFTLQSPVSGQVTSVFVNLGSTFPDRTPLFSVQTGDQVKIIRAVSAGRVTALLAKIGQVVNAGAALAVMERIDDADDRLVAVLYAVGTSGPTIAVGSPVDLIVQSVPEQQYGVLRGRVASVGQFPETRQQISDFLGDEQLGSRFTAEGQPLKIVVDLALSPGTESGYRWSSKDGPPFRIDSRTTVVGAIHMAIQRPIDWVIAP